MKKSRALAVAATLAAMVLYSAPADAQNRLVRIGFGGGFSVPTSHAADALDNGINGQAYVLLAGFPIPLRLNLGYQKFDFNQALATAAAGGQSTIISGVGGVSFNLINIGP